MSSDPTTDGRQPLTRFWQPRYWPIWLGLAVLRVLGVFPFPVQLAAGRRLGDLLYLVLPARRRIADTNLALCFPELSSDERRLLLRRHFRSLGMTIVEHGLAWWADDDLIRRLVQLRGEEHLRSAAATGRGVVLLTGHFGSQEFTGRVLRGVQSDFAGLYRPNRNALADEILKRIRAQSARELIPKLMIRRMIRLLRQGWPVWYAPDQSHRRSFSALLPFFGVPAMTNTALSEIVRLGNALVLPILPLRLPDAAGYTLEILPPLADFPGPDPQADTLRVNRIIEEHIRKAPEQYYWIHRRFKGRPPPYTDPY